MVEHKDFFYYQTYLQAGTGETERYLLSDDLFRPLGIQNYPSLTLGGLLFFQRCARFLADTASQRYAAQKLDTELEVLRTKWQVAWERKAIWEFNSRLRQWGQTLNDLHDRPQENAPYYRTEVRIRVLIELLQADLGALEAVDQQQLTGMDALLRAMFKPGGFIWEAELAPAFPQEAYWYLWGVPRTSAE